MTTPPPPTVPAPSLPSRAGKPEIRDGFKFRAGIAPLDLAGTLAGRLSAAPRELLAQPSDVARWLVAAAVADTAPEATAADLAFALALRESVYALALATIERRDLPEAARQTLNDLAALAPAIPRLTGEGGVRRDGTAAALLAGVARDAVLLLGGEMRLRIRQCEGPTCALLFLDTSRSGDRRWCSMAGCGNKAKVASFRQRGRGA